MGACSGKGEKDKEGIRYRDYEFMNHLPKETMKFKEMRKIDLTTKAKIIKGLDDPAVDESWKILLEERFATLHEITSHLYLSSVFGLNREDLEQNGIQFIINATTILPIIKEYRYRTLRVPVEDDRGADIYPFLDHTADAIHELLSDNKRVVVHCQAGVSRSAALIMAYLIKYERRTLRNAYNLVVSKRHVVRPNTTFLHGLIKFEKVHLHSASTKIIQVKKNGKIVELPNWMYYDLPSKFEDEFSGPGFRTMNSAKYVNPTQLLIDVDSDPEVFNKNRELILGPSPMTKSHHLATKFPTPPRTTNEQQVTKKVSIDAKPIPATTNLPHSPSVTVEAGSVGAEDRVVEVESSQLSPPNRQTSTNMTPPSTSSLTPPDIPALPAKTPPVKPAAVHKGPEAKPTIIQTPAVAKLAALMKPAPAPAAKQTHAPEVKHRTRKTKPAVPAKLPVTTPVTTKLSSRKKPSDLSLFPHQRGHNAEHRGSGSPGLGATRSDGKNLLAEGHGQDGAKNAHVNKSKS